MECIKTHHVYNNKYVTTAYALALLAAHTHARTLTHTHTHIHTHTQTHTQLLQNYENFTGIQLKGT